MPGQALDKPGLRLFLFEEVRVPAQYSYLIAKDEQFREIS
jgi:hypothetical protein